MRSTPNAPRAVYLGERFLDPGERPTVSLFDRGYLLGDSIFETLRCYRGVPFRLEAHLDRFAYGAAVLGMSPHADRAELSSLVREAVDRSGLDSASVRITLSRGEGTGTVSPAACTAPVLSIVVRPLLPYPASAYRDGIASMVVTVRRIPPACIDPAIKCGNYLPSVLGRRELDARNMVEGVQRSVDGDVVGGTVSNVFAVIGGELLTPPLTSGCLPGVTRAAVLALTAATGVPCREQTLRVEDLHDATELFFTNSLMECLPVATLDRQRLSPAPGPVTRRLHEAFQDLVDKEVAWTR
jgi:branched-chain amino acid aminotransferase